MMASFTAKLGGFDFSDYLRIGKGEGLDPSQSEFITPEFADSPYGDGAGLSSVGIANKQMAWPLYIDGGTKAGAIALEQQLNNIIANVVPLTLEWRDTGLSASTFWNVEFARFDRVFDKRPDDQGWAGGILRVWARPYGHTGTERLIASALATAPNSAVMIATVSPGSVIGDAPALTRARVTVGGTSIHHHRLVAISAVPANYQPWVPAASMTATLVADIRAPGSQAINLGTTTIALFSLTPSPFVGRVRVLGVMTADVGEVADPQAQVHLARSYAPTGPIALISSYAYSYAGYGPVDLGSIDIPTISATSTYGVNFAVPSGSTKNNDLPSGVWGRLAGVVVLPEDNTTFVLDPFVGDTVATDAHLIDLPGRANTRTSTNQVGAVEVVDVSAQTLGEDVTIGPSCAAIVTYVGDLEGASVNPMGVEISVRERFVFARP